MREMNRVLKGHLKYPKIQWLIVENANLEEKDETRHVENPENPENLEENIKNTFIYFIKIIKVFV
jgi:hypothetical protein